MHLSADAAHALLNDVGTPEGLQWYICGHSLGL